MEADDMQELKVRFYKLMVEYDMHEKDPFSLCSDYHSIYSTASVKADAIQWQAALKACVLYLVLSPYSNTQQDMLHRVVSTHYTALSNSRVPYIV
jgi:26S proteasome regulatory subunit N5